MTSLLGDCRDCAGDLLVCRGIVLEREADDEEGVRGRVRKTRRSNHGAFWQRGGFTEGIRFPRELLDCV
jgi:hypothetical protein